jgi:signal transduction histidine kinase
LEELIQVSSLDGGEMNLNPVMVDLNTVIDDAVSSLIAQLSEKNITLRVDLPDELPPIQADLEALQQILSNLLSNAAKATPADGQISLRARIEAKEHEPSFLLLQVADQGGGIPSADLPRVFSRLYRADNVLVQGIGDTGIGLALVKTLVEAHHGRIWVDTEAERGSTFSVLLPLTVTTVSESSGAAAG